jgi:hypothetical protein
MPMIAMNHYLLSLAHEGLYHHISRSGKKHEFSSFCHRVGHL